MYKHSTGIVLEKMSAYDLADLMKLKNTSWMSTHRTTFLNMTDQNKWFDKINSDLSYLMLMANVEGLGTVGIFKIDSIDAINRSCNVAWDIFEKFRGAGLGKKLVQAGVDFCLEVLNMHRLNAEILENNEPSIKCADAAGFVFEGNKKQAVYKLGIYIDSHVFGLVV